MKGIACFVLLVWIGLPLLGQNTDVRFTAYADAKQVLLNGYFNVTFTISNADGTDFRPPDFRDFELVSGPGRSSSMTIVNGRSSQETAYTYTLRPRRKGTFTIGSATVRVDGQTLRSNPVQVAVVEGSGNAGAERVYLQARLDAETAYVGQQLTLDYVLYTQVQVDGWNPLRESDYQGCYAREVRRFDNRVVREVINGVQYATRVLKRVVLYPQQSGTLNIAPFEAQLSVVAGEAPRRSLLMRPPVQRVIVSTEPITINVQPLPQPQPHDFSGITGTFIMDVRTNHTDLSTDDALSLYLSLRGEGDLKRIQAPPLNFPDAFETYDPKVTREDYVDYADRIQGVKSFEYLVVPTEPGNYTFRPEVVVFDPDSARYVTLRAAPISLQVSRGSGGADEPTIVEAPTEDLLHPFRERVELRRVGPDTFTGGSLYWVLLLLPLGGVWVTGLLRRIHRRRGTVDPALLRRQRARQQALDRLQTAKAQQEAGESRAFFAEVERAMLGYVGDKLEIPRSDMSKANVKARLEQLGASPERVERFLSVIQTCEMALYAGQNGEAAMADAYERAGEVLAEIEEALEG